MWTTLTFIWFLGNVAYFFRLIVFHLPIYPFLQNFASEPNVFVSVKYTRSTKPNDAMYLWLENVNSGGFEVCLREFLPFDGKHQDAVVVREVLCSSNKTIKWKITDYTVLSSRIALMHDVLHEVCKYDLCLVNSRAALFRVKYFCCLSRRDVSVLCRCHKLRITGK